MTTVRTLLARLAEADFDGAGALFADRVDWDIPGAAGLVPWIGPRRTGEEAAAFYRTLDDHLERDVFQVERVFADGDEAVVVGHLRAVARATGKAFATPFAIRLTVTDGRITRYLIVEDSHAVADAMRT
ncbi:MAG TPA: nuclear transport factor 2 family protein [Amycolatopsis sp.]|nr:nuclear transport factor 2 family protein [Amycolatopsis sp.]